ncbi:hypothetical protein BDY24DRAFT_418463 [Mrakia frigida]|uniref:uncharacterized protein n=1 Tax=Mrakia frigida TaxID=29902 RepID=UPI003FCBF70F
MMYNRGATDRKYGIYGHNLEDLALQGVRYDADTKEIYEILVSSHAQVLPKGDTVMQKVNCLRFCE